MLDYKFDESFKSDSVSIVCGTDEAGRGPLAGPVVAAACILPDGLIIEGLDDSKKLTDKKRRELFPVIKEQALAYGIGMASEQEIDEINILNASILAMHRALDGLNVVPGAIIVDGNRFKPYGDIPHETFVKGDGRFGNIAAASILAKTHRDEYMCRLHEEFPQYGWNVNKGYPTKAHREAIENYGVTPYHRVSFRLIDPQLSLF